MKDNALYLEVDEDITSAIDKLQKLSAESVQIVVPKRSTMLQSVINLKLLKKAAADSGKKLVLVTNDKVATSLAGRVGLAVAPSLGAEAVMATAPEPMAAAMEDVIEASDPEPEAPAAVVAPGGQETPTEATATPKKPLFARRKLDDKPSPSAAAPSPAMAGSSAAAAEAADSAKPSGPKVPNFNRMQRRLLWVGLAVALVVGYVVAMYFMTSAKVTLYAVASKVAIDMNFSADPNLHQTDSDKGVLAGQTVTYTKDISVPFTPTGQKDVGTKAGGTMTVKNEYDSNPHTLSAGTRFAAPDGKLFRTNSDVTVPGATATIQHGQVTLQAGSASVAVTADQNGDSYNEAAARYTIVAYSGDMQAKIYGQGAQMSGGTSKTVTVVTQADVDKAKSDAMAKDKDGSQKALDGKVPSGYVALSGSQQQSVVSATASPAVDQEATNASLVLKLSYTELSAKKSEYTDLVEAKEQKQVGDKNQIYDNGIGAATITATPADSTGRQNFHFTTDAYSGAKLDKTAIASSLKGKRYGDASDIAAKNPGVQRVEISIWPGWITTLPSRSGQITIVISVADNKGN